MRLPCEKGLRQKVLQKHRRIRNYCRPFAAEHDSVFHEQALKGHTAGDADRADNPLVLETGGSAVEHPSWSGGWVGADVELFANEASDVVVFALFGDFVERVEADAGLVRARRRRNELAAGR